MLRKIVGMVSLLLLPIGVMAQTSSATDTLSVAERNAAQGFNDTIDRMALAHHPLQYLAGVSMALAALLGIALRMRIINMVSRYDRRTALGTCPRRLAAYHPYPLFLHCLGQSTQK